MRALILAVAVLLPLSAQAQKKDQEARAHFEAGVAAATAKNYRRAAAEFEAAYRLSPRPILLFNIGQAYRLLGDNAKAADAYRRYLDDDPRGLYADQAREWLAEVKSKLADQDAGQDRGSRADSSAAGRNAVTTGERGAQGESSRGGDQSGDARVRSGTKSQGTTEEVGSDQSAERQRAELEAAMRAAQNDDTVFAGDGSIVGTRSKSQSSGASTFGTLGYTGIATIGVGLFMSGTSLYFGIKSQDLQDDIEGARDQWTDEQLEGFERGERFERTSQVFAGFGVPLVALGAGLLIADLMSDDPGSARGGDELEIGPELSSERAGLVVTGRF